MLDNLTQEQVQSLLTYEPSEGLLRWKNNAGRYGRISAGTIAGRIHKEGYRYLTILGRHYRASRIVWLYMTGEWPSDQVDHKDHDTSNDKWDNLRLATASQNKANCRTYKKKSCTLKGVQAVQKRRSVRYRAVATKDGVIRHLGYFDTELEAHLAYVKASESLHGDFACDGRGAV